MAILPLSLSGVPNLLQGTIASQQLNSTQQQLLTVQNQLSTGLAVNTPSDNPAAASLIEQLNRTLTTSQAYSTNINAATSQLGVTDSTLGNLTTLLQQAEQIASANVGSDVTDSARQAAAAVAKSLYSQALSIANTKFAGQFLFGGASGTQQPFVEALGGVQFTGTAQPLQNAVDPGTQLSLQANGAAIFGAFSSRVQGTADLSPSLTNNTRLIDLNGANGTGVSIGSIQISNGVVTQIVNLTGDQNVGDVVNSINQAGVGGITASITGQGLTLTGAPADNISVTDVGTGTTAASFGIATAPGGAGAGVPVVGTSLQPLITGVTPLSTLRNGAGIDNTGLTITNGLNTKTITWPPTGNVQDMLNAINGAGLGLHAQINSTGTGIDILNSTQGINLSIAENGGTTAADLGVQSMATTTPLSELNFGAGVTTAGGATPDFQITRADGTTFSVSVSAATTVQDVIDEINTADGGGGVTASFDPNKNSIVLTDTTGGPGTPTVTQLNDSLAAKDLGLTAPAVGNVINGANVNQVQSTGIFGDLQALIAGLQTSNQDAITAAGQAITNDTNNVITNRGQVGAIEQQLSQRQTSLTQQNTATQTLLSQLQDTDYTTAITKFQTLQTALQAGLQTTAHSMQYSLLDYLV